LTIIPQEEAVIVSSGVLRSKDVYNDVFINAEKKTYVGECLWQVLKYIVIKVIANEFHV